MLEGQDDYFSDDSAGSYGWIEVQGTSPEVHCNVSLKTKCNKYSVHSMSDSEDSELSDNDVRMGDTMHFNMSDSKENDSSEFIATSNPMNRQSKHILELGENQETVYDRLTTGGSWTCTSNSGVKMLQQATSDTPTASLDFGQYKTCNMAGVVLEEISKDEEVWLVQCPSNVSEEVFLNQCLRLGGTSQCTTKSFMIASREFKVKVSATAQKPAFCCMLPDQEHGCYKTVVLQSAGHIVLTELFGKCQSTGEVSAIPTKRRTSLPVNLKLRHPLFGQDFERSLRPSVVCPKKQYSNLLKHAVEEANPVEGEHKRKKKAEHGGRSVYTNKYSEGRSGAQQQPSRKLCGSTMKFEEHCALTSSNTEVQSHSRELTSNVEANCIPIEIQKRSGVYQHIPENINEGKKKKKKKRVKDEDHSEISALNEFQVEETKRKKHKKHKIAF